MNINMEKPITLLREDFIEQIVSLCNNSGLPFFIIEDVLKNLISDTHTAALQQIETDKKYYQEQLAKANASAEKFE